MKRFLSWLIIIGSFFVYSYVIRLFSRLVLIVIGKFLEMNLLAQIITIAVGGMSFLFILFFPVSFAASKTIEWSNSVCPSKRGTRFVFSAAAIIILSILELISYIGSDVLLYVGIFESFYIAYAVMLIRYSVRMSE